MLFPSGEDLTFLLLAVSWWAGGLERLRAGAFQGPPHSWALAPPGFLPLLQRLSWDRPALEQQPFKESPISTSFHSPSSSTHTSR